MHYHRPHRSLEQMRCQFKLSQTGRSSKKEFIRWMRETTTMPHHARLKAGMFIKIQTFVVWSS
jgi:hypothetical protein